MNEEQSSQKRRPIRIKVPRKPSAPRHSAAVVRDTTMARPTGQIGSTSDSLRLSAIQQVIVLLFAVGGLDGGALFQMVVYAIIGYWGGVLMITRRGRQTTRLDNFLIRWGFIILCIISFFISNAVWAARFKNK